jgi:glycosyltransferase involved in cell wall biosynthesis
LRIVFTIDSLAQGGTEQSILELIKNFSDDNEVFVIYFYPRHDLLKAFEQTKCKIHFLDLKGRYNWLSGIQKLKIALKKIKPDLVIASLYRSNIITRISCLMLRIKLIGTFVEDNYGIERKKTFKGIKGKLKFYPTLILDIITSFIPFAWISNSIVIGKNHVKHLGISEKKVHVIYRGRNSKEIHEWIPPLSNKFSFVIIGRLYEKKGFTELVAAFSVLEKIHPNISLIIYGEGPQRKDLENQINILQLQKKVILAGNTPKAYMKLYDANCFVFPSRFEGFSGALVEAMMAGIPIICSDIPMNTEAVDHEITALVHKLKDTDDLFKKMILMIEKYPEMIEMGKRAREKALMLFEIKEIAKKYEQLLIKLND